MKRYNNLYSAIYSFPNLLAAYKQAFSGKKKTDELFEFQYNLENAICGIEEELRMKTYSPGNYRSFTIIEPKERLISAAPFRDRVVHHALCNIIQPLFESSFIFDSYSNRVGKGTHKAILQCKRFAMESKYVLKCDIKKYFPSIDHQVLKAEIRRKIKCEDTLWLIDLIIDKSNEQEEVIDYFPGDDLFTPAARRKGLPIGNLTSQNFANIYLNGMDHFIKEKMGIKHYIRYVDDFVLFGDNKKKLWQDFEVIQEYLDGYRLKLHGKKSMVYKTEGGVNFLGHKVFPEFILLKRENKLRIRKKMKILQVQYSEHKISMKKIIEKMQSWDAHARFSRTFRLRTEIYEQYPFILG